MKKLSLLRLGLIVLGCSAVAQVVTATTVPFAGAVAGDVVGSPRGETFLYDVELSGAGKATELGKFTVFATHTTNGSTGRITGGSITFVTKHGDTLTGTYVGQEFPTDSPDVVLVLATLTITGGTGRFSGATGTVPLTATVTIEDITPEGVFIETFTASFDGMLTLPD